VARREEDALAYEVELIEYGNFVRLTLWGVLTRTDHEEFRAKARSALAETGWAKVLIDTTGADPEMSLTDDFKFTSGHQSQLPPNLRTAIVHRADETARYRFIENVAINRGVNIRTFTDKTEALAWLLDS
jgi:hypothetical protein